MKMGTLDEIINSLLKEYEDLTFTDQIIDKTKHFDFLPPRLLRISDRYFVSNGGSGNCYILVRHHNKYEKQNYLSVGFLKDLENFNNSNRRK